MLEKENPVSRPGADRAGLLHAEHAVGTREELGNQGARNGHSAHSIEQQLWRYVAEQLASVGIKLNGDGTAVYVGIQNEGEADATVTAADRSDLAESISSSAVTAEPVTANAVSELADSPA